MPLVPPPAAVREQRDACRFPAFGNVGVFYNSSFCKESKKYVVPGITSSI